MIVTSALATSSSSFILVFLEILYKKSRLFVVLNTDDLGLDKIFLNKYMQIEGVEIRILT